MTGEFPGSALDLAALVDYSVLAELSAVSAEARERLAEQAWEVDNNWALERLAVCIDDLAFPEIVARKAESIRAGTDKVDKGMVLRRLSWLPDNSETTREHSRSTKLRAVYGHAVLLSGRSAGVEGDYFEQSEHADSIFYSLGVAVEQDEKLLFYRLFAADLGDQGLYEALTARHYDAKIRHFNDAYGKAFFGSNFLNHDRPEEVIAAENAVYKKLEEDFANNMREVETEPRVSGQPQYTDYVHRVLLGIGEKPKNVREPDDYCFASQLADFNSQDLSSQELGLNRMTLDQQFEEHLKTSPVVRDWLGR